MSDKNPAPGTTQDIAASRAGGGSFGGGPEREPAGGGDRGVKDKLRSQADELIDAAKQRAKGVAVEQKDAAAAQLGCVARGLRQAADSMGAEGEIAGRYARKAAENLERLSTDLRGAEFDDLVERTENYARRNPALFIGGAVAAGFLLARFLRSSGRRARRPAAASYGAAQSEL